MHVGMLWFDNDKKADLTTKIERAASYYHNKYGRRPDVCFVHPSSFPTSGPQDAKSNQGDDTGSMFVAGDVEVRTMHSLIPNHLWIGVNDGNGYPKV